MLQKTHSAFVAFAIGTLGLASIIGSYKLVKTTYTHTGTDYQTQARQTSTVDKNKFTPNQPAANIPKGFVTGKLCYPDNFLPEGKITAKNIDSQIIYTLYFAGSKNSAKPFYYFALIPGTYKLRYETFSGTNQLKPNAGYFVQKTSEPKPAIIEVEPDKTVPNIDLCYYYPSESEPEF